MDMTTKNLRCATCGKLVSRNGWTWGPGLGYRPSRGADGTRIVGTVGRPDGRTIYCKSCCARRVEALNTALNK